jgi:glycosyltransferase involved in cell wall biosynthesis
MTLGLIADTRHSLDSDGRLCTLTPVVRQLDLWADWFPEMIACVPLLPGPPPPTHTPYQRLRVSLCPLRVGGGNTPGAKLGLLGRSVGWWPQIRRVIDEVDAVHLRCPCNIGLLGILAVQRSDRPRYAMYAGQWQEYPGQPFFSRLQRRLLARPGFGGPVAIYGSWPEQPPHLVSSFSPTFTFAEWEAEALLVERRLAALQRPWAGPVRLMTVGHLDTNKGQATIVSAVAALRQHGLEVTLDCLGDGPLRSELLAQVARLGLSGAVVLHGAQPHRFVRECYRRSHINVLASRTEGYPKVLAEGMLHGTVPVAADVGINAQILDHGRRGATFAGGDAMMLAQEIRALVEQRERFAGMISQGRQYTRTVTLEAFQELTRRTLVSHWRLAFPGADRRESLPAASCSAP